MDDGRLQYHFSLNSRHTLIEVKGFFTIIGCYCSMQELYFIQQWIPLHPVSHCETASQIYLIIAFLIVEIKEDFVIKNKKSLKLILFQKFAFQNWIGYTESAKNYRHNCKKEIVSTTRLIYKEKIASKGETRGLTPGIKIRTYARHI